MNKALINFLHIKCASMEIVRQIAAVLVMQKRRDDSVRDRVRYSSLSPPRAHERDAEREGKLA